MIVTDRRRLMLIGSLLMGIALVGLSFSSTLGMFYLFYIFNALGYVLGGPLPCQVLISRWFDNNRGKAMGIAYLGIGTGGALVPLISSGLEKTFGWHHGLDSPWNFSHSYCLSDGLFHQRFC